LGGSTSKEDAAGAGSKGAEEGIAMRSIAHDHVDEKIGGRKPSEGSVGLTCFFYLLTLGEAFLTFPLARRRSVNTSD